jgi:hypothetical protein
MLPQLSFISIFEWTQLVKGPGLCSLIVFRAKSCSVASVNEHLLKCSGMWGRILRGTQIAQSNTAGSENKSTVCFITSFNCIYIGHC